MEQTPTMDKKNHTRPLPLSKNNQDPSKASFEHSSKKNGPQYSRKRENEKFDNKKSSSRGGRAGQRYVRPREKMGSQIEEKDESEYGSLQKTGSKKQNITHLLNWWGPGPERRGLSSEHSCGRGYKNWKHTVHHAKYNKEHYLQANCQFIVSSGHDYSLYEKDPDHLVDWEYVEEVRLHMSEAPACPICLYPPVAAKVTRCGHIFCFSCVLHYLALTDEKWRKCPICFDAVAKTDLKSAVAILHKDFVSSQVIELKLMRRERDSLVPIPSTSCLSSMKNIQATLSSPEEVISYSKLIVASRSEVSKFVVAREVEALQCQLALEGDQPEACFIEEALSLASRRDSLLKSNTGILPTVTEKSSLCESFDKGMALGELHDEIDPMSESRTLNEKPFVSREEFSPESSLNICPEDLDIGQLQGGVAALNMDEKTMPKSNFYFYQESSGAHVYLHALNVHMLVKEYGSLEKCPHTIKAKVLEKESDSMTDSLRQRLRYLRHLPVSCPFEVVEIEMMPPLVSQLTVADFQGQLDLRERKRKKRAKEENRIEKRVQIEEDRMMGRSRGSKINMTSFRHFPSFAEEPSPPMILEEDPLLLSTSVGSSSSENVSGMSPPSFAQMTRCGQKKPLNDFPLMNVSPTNDVRGHCMPALHGNGGALRKHGSSDDDDDEAERVPNFRRAFSDAFDKALDEATKKASDKTSMDDSHQGRRGKKKKKGIVLLSSGGR